MEKLEISLLNVHCDDCARTIYKKMSELFQIEEHNIRLPPGFNDSNPKVDDNDEKPHVSLQLKDNGDQLIIIGPSGSLSKNEISIQRKLENAGFVIESFDIYISSKGDTEEGLKLSSHNNYFLQLLYSGVSKFTWFRRHENHMHNCAICRAEHEEEKKRKTLQRQKATQSAKDSIGNLIASISPTNRDSIISSHSDDLEDEAESEGETLFSKEKTREYRALFTIPDHNGDDYNEIKKSLDRSLKELNIDEKHPQKESSNNDKYDPTDEEAYTISDDKVVVILPEKQYVNQIINNLRQDTKLEINLIEILPVERSLKYQVMATIGGMTCSACSSAVTNALSDLDYVTESSINVLTRSGKIIIDSCSQDLLDHLKETVEDIGYDFEIYNVQEINHAANAKQSRTVNLKIEGMFCDHCPESINDLLKTYGDHVMINRSVSYNHPYLKFTYVPNPPSLTIRRIIDEINNLNSNFKVSIVKHATIEEQLSRMARVELNRVLKRLIITFIIAIPTFIFGVVGMSLLKKENSFKMWLDEPIWTGNVSRVTWILFILATIVYFFTADMFHLKAISEIRVLWRPNIPYTRRFLRFGSMNLLVSLGTSIAYFASIVLLALSASTKRQSEGYTTTYFDSVIFLTFFLSIGKLMEAYAKKKTLGALNKLSDFKITQGTLINNGEESGDGHSTVVDVDYLEIGDFIQVSVGESPPCDSIIHQGDSEFDESALTGESNPVKHIKGDQIFAGTVNKGPSTIVAKVSSLQGSSLLDKIVEVVRDGQLNKAPIEKIADRLTSFFVPIITLLAIITWIIWLALGCSGSLPQSYLDIDVGGWVVWSMEFSIAVFVVACPCGIGLAAPTALFMGAGIAAKNGILVKSGGSAFQEGSKIEVVCFDKTGTLTLGGDPKVEDFKFVTNEFSAKEGLQAVRDLESSSKHPLSIAVKSFVAEYTKNNSITLTTNQIPEVSEVSGRGLKGKYEETSNEEAVVGNELLLNENDVFLSEEDKDILDTWKRQGKSVLLVAIKRRGETNKFHPVLYLSARDQIRPEAPTIITELSKLNIESFMISGDNEITAKAIAKEVGIKESNVIAGVLPEEKAKKVEEIQSTFHENPKRKAVVAMVGDGINDAPALVTANVGIAMGSGTDLALSSCDFVLLSPTHPLITLYTLIHLSKKVLRRVYFNFAWALVYNIIGIPIAAGVIYPYHNSRLSPVWASAAMALSSVSVILSSYLGLRFYKPATVDLIKTDTAPGRQQQEIQQG